jgi:putative colanic acid biosynthesis UDP-glucose lipid carrier transferase
MVQTSTSNFQLPYAPLLILRRIAAAIIAVLSLRSIMVMYGIDLNDHYQALIIIVFLLALMIFPGQQKQDLTIQDRFWSMILVVAARWLLLISVLLLLGYATKTSSIFSRKLLFTWIIVTPPIIVLAGFCINVIITHLVISAENSRRVVVAGANEAGRLLAQKIIDSPKQGMTFIGFFDDRSADRLKQDPTLPILGKLTDLPDYIRANGVDVIFISLPIRNIQRVSELLDRLHDSTASIYYVPDVYVFDLIQCRTGQIDGVPVIALCETPFRGTQALVKRLSDYVIASTVLALASPLMIMIAMAIKFTSPGPVIFRQRRYGLDGREIYVYKFRSMTVCEDSGPIKQATKNDARVTPLGALLRRYSLDELPQFINVLQGSMSVVGPRPHAISHNEQYRPLVKQYMVRHKVNPGITGLAQIHGCRGETSTVEDMQRRVNYDLEYLRDWSLMLDLRIILKTIGLIFKDDMAY